MSQGNAYVVVVGNELIRGRPDANGPFLARELSNLGFQVAKVAVVGDDQEAVAWEVRAGLDRGVAVLVVCGGLGPTRDDVTRRAVADALGVDLVPSPEAMASVRARAATFGDVDEASVASQGMVLEGGEWLANQVGVAPGLYARKGLTDVYVLPGPPPELQDMFSREVKPRVAGRAGPWSWALVRTVGLREVTVSARVAPVLRQHPQVEVAFLPSPAMVDVVLSSRTTDVSAAAGAVVSCLGASVYDTGGRSLEEVVEAMLVARGQHLVTAESCTGGMLGELLTSVPGSSACYRGGVVAYSNELKEHLLDVPAEMLLRHGAVSQEVARAMATGARARLGGDWAVSITGIAGPGGGTPAKPVGLVFCGLAGPDGLSAVERHQLGGDRASIRMASARLALDLLRRHLQGGGP